MLRHLFRDIGTSSFVALAAASLTGCGADDATPSGDDVADTEQAATTCGVTSGKLRCSNQVTGMLEKPFAGSRQVNVLRTTYSWFKCWAVGQAHAGGNTTWYYTLGDDNANWGWVPAVKVNTTGYFDTHASSYGLPRCAVESQQTIGDAPPGNETVGSAPSGEETIGSVGTEVIGSAPSETIGSAPPPVGSSSSCKITSSRLYCTNDVSPLRNKPYFSGSQVNVLRTTYSWFKCWTTGQIHGGGNNIWYYTLGDDNGNWGYLPAVEVLTTGYFDAHASSYGLPRCQY
ncbi:MAG TPA: hypothetical protein VMS65_13850 [Polyangiaceae bacterium]|nr:hypothetical protein [Polyangiaceae bacterium]